MSCEWLSVLSVLMEPRTRCRCSASNFPLSMSPSSSSPYLCLFSRPCSSSVASNTVWLGPHHGITRPRLVHHGCLESNSLCYPAVTCCLETTQTVLCYLSLCFVGGCNNKVILCVLCSGGYRILERGVPVGAKWPI